jgi:hypothetical protein
VRGRGTRAHGTEYGIDGMAVGIGRGQPVIVVLLAVFVPLGFQLA